MKQKTFVKAEDNKQEILITREFDLPLELLFKAYIESDLIEQWMGTKVIKLESKKHGSYQFETSHDGNVVFKANGTIHEIIENQTIIRTFEMEGTTFPAQLEFLEFSSITKETSLLTMHIVLKSVEYRNQLLQLPFAKGIEMAHDRLQNIFLNNGQ